MRDQGRCKDCKHFSPDIAGAGLGPGFGSCARWRFGYQHKLEECPKNELIVENDEGWGAWIGPEFGCVLFEPK